MTVSFRISEIDAEPLVSQRRLPVFFEHLDRIKPAGAQVELPQHIGSGLGDDPETASMEYVGQATVSLIMELLFAVISVQARSGESIGRSSMSPSRDQRCRSSSAAVLQKLSSSLQRAIDPPRKSAVQPDAPEYRVEFRIGGKMLRQC